jgi:hypothetical protein
LLWFPDKRSPLAVLRFPAQNVPSCTMWFRQFTKNVTNNAAIPTQSSTTHILQHTQLVSKLFHTGHVVAHVVLWCLLLRFGP